MKELYWMDIPAPDGQPRLFGNPVQVGVTVRVKGRGKPRLFRRGIHAAKRLCYLFYFCSKSGPFVLCRVSLGGTVVHEEEFETGLSVASEATIHAMLTVEETEKLLRESLRRYALSTADRWDMPDIVRQYLETGDESLQRRAYAAARSAAMVAGGGSDAARVDRSIRTNIWRAAVRQWYELSDVVEGAALEMMGGGE